MSKNIEGKVVITGASSGLGEAAARTQHDAGALCGKKPGAELIRDVGFDPVDAGPLRIARYTEPFALLVAQLALRGKRRPRTGVSVRAVWEMRGGVASN